MNKITIKRHFDTFGKIVEVAKDENISLEFIINGKDGNGFNLIIIGNDFASSLLKGLKLSEIQDGLEKFTYCLVEDDVKFKNNIAIHGSDILANIHRDEDCAQIIKLLSPKERKESEKKLLDYRRKQ